MADHPASLSPAPRGPAWKWWVCGLLLLATTLNYMDRVTLNQMSDEILVDFGLDEGHYGQLESAFAYAFAMGAIVAGWLADRWSVRWVYPAAVLAWSAAGFATGLVQGFVGLVVCRFLLGLMEAANWPCALKTTQQVVPPEERTMGNGILQSGAALGAILTPLIVLAIVVEHRVEPHNGTWRYPFMIVGALGIAWVVAWNATIRTGDLDVAPGASSTSLGPVLALLVFLFGVDTLIKLGVAAQADKFPQLVDVPFITALAKGPSGFPIAWPLFIKFAVTLVGILGVFYWLRAATSDDPDLPRREYFRGFWVLSTLVVSINLAWHFFRAWLPLFLHRQHKYTLSETQYFTMGYYLSTDIGSLSAGFITLWLVRRGWPVHRSRVTMFLVCAALTTLSVLAARLPAGALLLGTLLVIGFGSLGLFPTYYSFSQEWTTRHQGKLTGALGCVNWLAMALLHEVIGESVKKTRNYSAGVAVAGLFPLVGVAALLLFWPTRKTVPAKA